MSDADIDELKNGRGWGLAKAAELNGVPDPSHLLEMKKEIDLTPDQIEQIVSLFQKMKKQESTGVETYRPGKRAEQAFFR